MDPNAALERLRSIFLANKSDQLVGDALEEAFEEVDELFSTLDRWIAKGGFVPDDWNMFRSKTHPGRPLSHEQVLKNERLCGREDG